MRKRKEGTTEAGPAIPQYWTQTLDGTGATVLTHAIRGGMAPLIMAAFGIACLAGGIGSAYWLITEGEMSIGGAIFILVAPGGVAAFGVYCLNIAVWARTEYAFTRHGVTERRYSVWGDKTRQIERGSIDAISQNYSPPSSGSGSQGTWATLIEFTDKQGAYDHLLFDGMDTKAEAQWLGPWVTEWAGVSLKRGFGDAYQEADEKELPQLDE